MVVVAIIAILAAIAIPSYANFVRKARRRRRTDLAAANALFQERFRRSARVCQRLASFAPLEPDVPGQSLLVGSLHRNDSQWQHHLFQIKAVAIGDQANDQSARDCLHDATLRLPV
jgi:Tfp pilus assembly protein PilE